MQKAHDASKNNYWKNYPDVSTPIVQDELNRNEQTVDTLDDRIIVLDNTKANQSDLLQSLKTVSYNSTTGVFVFTFWNGTTVRADLNIEQIPVSFSMSAQGVITMTTADGTQYTADVSTLIKTYSFVDSDEIHITTTTDASGNKTVTASIVSGSITADKLQPNYLADITTQANRSTTAASTATTASNNSEAFATGKINGADVPSTHPAYHNNAKYYADQASGAVAGVASFNARAGAVLPQDGDYAIEQITPTNGTEGQVPTVNSQGKLEMRTPTSGGVTAFNGRTGAVTPQSDDYTKAMVGLGNVDNTSDADKPVSTAMQTALNAKANTADLGTASAKDVPTSGNASTTQVVMGNDTRLTDARTPTAHTHAASDVTAGTLAGQVVANATAVQTLNVAQVRNIYAGTEDMTPGTTDLATGTLYIVYE